ncbi:unnamed protein product, partial [marine sediment metagenome]
PVTLLIVIFSLVLGSGGIAGSLKISKKKVRDKLKFKLK